MSRMMCLSVCLLAACSEDGLFTVDGAGAENGADSASAEHAGANGLDTGYAGPAVWYTFAASLPIVEGAPSLEGATGRVVLADGELDRRDCAPVASTAITVGEVPEVDETLFVWWQFDLTELGECATPGLPSRLGVGIGALDAEVRARLGTVDRENDADKLYGAWLSTDDGLSVFPFGYADAGSVDAATAPAPDGTYELVPLLLLPLPPTE